VNNVKLEMHDKLSDGLDVGQQGKLYFFLEDFEENMRRMVQRVRDRSRVMEGGRMGRGGGPPPLRAMRDRLPRGSQGGDRRGPDSKIPNRDGGEGTADARSEAERGKPSNQP